jgi:SAM-dependent methyltransferase
MDTVSGRRDWEGVYKNGSVEDMPWFSKELDEDVKNELTKRKMKDGEALDLGTGPGTQALGLSKIGFKVTAVDISKSAIKSAKKLSGDIDFVVDDILDIKLKKKFDLILDRGCFHIIEPDDRKIYLKNIKNLINRGGLLFLKCFSNRMPETGFGPHRISEEILRQLFSEDFEIEKIIHTEFRGNRMPHPKALFAVMRRKL